MSKGALKLSLCRQVEDKQGCSSDMDFPISLFWGGWSEAVVLANERAGLDYYITML